MHHHNKVHDTYKKAAEAADMHAAAATAAAAEAAADNAEADAAAAGDGAQAAPEDLARACREQVCPLCEEKKVADDMRLRMAAEMENFKKRLSREHEEQMRYAAEKILREGRGKNEDRHIGLHNIYERLRAFYGRAEFRFSSVPYFENTVEIRLPARFFTDPDPADPDLPAAKTRTFVQYSKQPPIDKPPPGRLQ